MRERNTLLEKPCRVQDRDGTVIIGGFPERITEREGRIAAAQETVRRAVEECETASGTVSDAKTRKRVAIRRQEGAQAATAAAQLQGQISELRDLDQSIRGKRETLSPALDNARQESEEVTRLDAVRSKEIEELQRKKAELQRGMKDRGRIREARKDEQAKLGLPALATDWDGTHESAQEHLLQLPIEQESWRPGDWWEEARRLVDRALSECFPPGTSISVPEEIKELRSQFSGAGPGHLERAQLAFPTLRHAVHIYLRIEEKGDDYERRQIVVQRQERHESFEAARLGHDEAVKASQAFRGTLESAIRKKLADVSAAFDRLDTDYGGYGAELRYETPPSPTDPTQEWGWKVTPMWRRHEGSRLIPYNRRANTAQIDEKAIKLVCAAAVASGTGRPVVLVLDELGRNLGKQHRREAVALLGQIGRDSGITVVGALQDDMEPYAIDACGEYIKLRRSSDSSPYNEQPVVIGYDEQAPRVKLLSAWLTGNDYQEPE